jgi:predicted porin
VGGRFARWGATAFSDADQQSYGIGASYRVNSWTVGVDWSRGNYDEVFLDVGSGEDSDVIAFTSSYALRPNVKVSGLLEYSEDQPAQDSAAPGAFTVGIGTLINF